MRATALSLLSITLVSACSSVQVDRVPPDVLRDMRRVCIERNPRVIVTDFLSVVQDGFRRHGIETAVYDSPLLQELVEWVPRHLRVDGVVRLAPHVAALALMWAGVRRRVGLGR
jgi:hypothetical protein